MTSPKVTVGLPVYNGERYLRETIESILAQDFEDFELLVSDNASTDDTPSILAQYAARDGRVVVHRQPSNLGAASNYNWLANNAAGEYFKWASADDLLRPTLLSRCVTVLDQNPDVVLAYPKTTLVGPDGRALRDHEDGLHLPQPQSWLRLRDFALNRWLCNPCFGLMRTLVARSTGLIRPTISSDVTFLAEMALAGPIHEVPERLFLRRVVETSCGLGRLSRSEVAHWFAPGRDASRAPMVRVFGDIEKAIWRRPDPLAVRARTSATFGYAWCKRQVGIQFWRARCRFHRSPRRSWLDTVEEV